MLRPDELHLDVNSGRGLTPPARAALVDFLDRHPVNPSSPNEAGRRTRRALEHAREQLADAFDVTPSDVIATSGGTEANHLAIAGLLAPRPSPVHVITSALEHASVLAACHRAERAGHSLTILSPSAEGRIEVEAVERALRPTTGLVALQAAQGDLGVLQPIAALAPILRQRDIRLHVDAVQVLGKGDPPRVGDTVAYSGHKIGALPGIGALCVRAGTPFRPPVLGGTQERSRRGGTENVAGWITFAAAIAACEPWSADARDAFEAALADTPVTWLGRGAPRLPNTSFLLVPGHEARDLLARLSRQGIHASTGSACRAGSAEPSATLRALGFGAADAASGLRISFGPSHSETDGRRAATTLGHLIASMDP